MTCCDYFASSATPRLLILLTDELEESVKVVNRLIDQQIEKNFSGNEPKNHCSVSVIGYNHNVKELCSGWLKELDARPLRYEIHKKKMITRLPDGVGGFLEEKVEIEVKRPIWVNFVNDNKRELYYMDTLIFTKSLIERWAEDHQLAPIILDCSEVFNGRDSIDEIIQLKNIATHEGNTLFFGSYSKEEESHTLPFSKMPIDWKWKFKIWGLNEKKYDDGLFSREDLFYIFNSMTFMAHCHHLTVI